MKFYFAARYSRAEELRLKRDELVLMGHQVTSRWIDHHGGKVTTSILTDLLTSNPGAYSYMAETDMIDLRAASVLINFTETVPGGKGGRHFEFGYAVGLGKRIVTIGPREHVFHTLSNVFQFNSWNLFISHLLEKGN